MAQGLGKTIQTISLLAYLMEKKGVKGPHLIIAPKPVLPNWQSEFAKWLPTEMTVILYDGKPEDRKALREEFLVRPAGRRRQMRAQDATSMSALHRKGEGRLKPKGPDNIP